jgi:4-diphosphocytidyl-2-C-methyl-D-erythritol kinase
LVCISGRQFVSALSIFAPAKLNLFLAITGKRADGFHDLVSLVVKLDFGDTLEAEIADEFSLTCNDPDVPCDESNLVLKAARAFAAASGWRGAARFNLDKKIPMGAGLGGGSSDAIATLRALNHLAGPAHALPPAILHDVAAALGSDCPLFLHNRPVVMRGRGERIEMLGSEAAERLRGRPVIVFKPGFGISTPWAYRQLAEGAPESYLAAVETEARLRAWLEDAQAAAETILFNNMEAPAFRKFVALPVLLQQLRNEYGLEPRMSGSGSACFAFLRPDSPISAIQAAIRSAWGASAFAIQARVT